MTHPFLRGILITARPMFLRMIRNVSGLVMNLGMPLLLIPILGSVFSRLPADIPYMRGVASPMAFFAFGFLVMFQMFSGGYSATYVRDAFLSPMKWRMRGLACAPAAVVLGIVAAATLIGLCQGLLVIAVSRLALGVRWGSLPVLAAVLLGVSLLSQFVNLVILLSVRNHGLATGLNWIYGFAGSLLGGLLFPLPVEKPFFRFMADYGTPYSLAQTAMRQSAPGGSPETAAFCVAALFLAAALFAGIAALLGRRKLA